MASVARGPRSTLPRVDLGLPRALRERGAAIKQRNPRYAGDWLLECLEDGLLAQCAWSGYTRMPKAGLYRCLDHAMGRVSEDSLAHFLRYREIGVAFPS